MTNVTLHQATLIANGALDKGVAEGFDPLTVAVLDSGGHVVALVREDGSGILRPEIAVGKAYGVLGFGLGGRALNAKNDVFLASVGAASQGRMIPVPGGVLIRDTASDAIIGAVGISGDSSENDEAAAVAGIQDAGLKADTGGKS